MFSSCRGVGYPDLWPSYSCKEPLDVSKNVTFDVISGILSGKTSLKWRYSCECLYKHMLNIMLWVDLAKLNRKFKPKPKDLHPSLKQLTRNLLKTEINLVRPDLDFFFSNLFFFGKQVYWTKKSSDLKSIWTENDLVETETNLVWSNAIRPEVSLTHNWTEWPVCQF